MISARASLITAILALSPLLGLLPHLISHHAYAEERLDVDNMAKEFFCTCGCNMLLSVCETQMTCSVASSMKGEIQGMINQGMSKQEIIDSMIGKYGNTVLAVPPMQGFTLALWWYPVIGGILGVLVISMVARRRSNVKWRIDPDEVVVLDEEELLKKIEIDEAASAQLTDKYDDLLRKRLKEAED